MMGASQAYAQSSNSDAWTKRFLNEAPRKWEEYRLQGRRIQGSCLMRHVDLVTGKVLSEGRSECKQRDGCALEITEPLGEQKDAATVEAINTRYAFRLRRKGPDGPWVIVGLSLDVEHGYLLGLYSPTLSVRDLLIDKAFSFSSVRAECLLDTVKHPSLVIKSAVPVSRQDQQLIRLAFTSQPRVNPPRIEANKQMRPVWNPVAGGWVVLDPDRYWLLREFEAQTVWEDQSTGVMTGTLTYKDGENQLPILSRIVVR